MIDFEPTAEQQELVKWLRGFLDKHVRPVANQRDHTLEPRDRFPWDIIAQAHDFGAKRVPLSERYGGAGANALTLSMLSEEMGAADLGVASVLMQGWMTSRTIEQLGTEDQKRRFIDPYLDDPRYWFAVGQTEPQSGTENSIPTDDPSLGPKLSAVADGDEIVLNGMKHFVTLGPFAKTIFLHARTDRTVPHTQGMTVFLVPTDTPGFKVGHIEDCFGQRLCPVGEIIFEDCRIPKANQFTPWNEDHKMLQRSRAALFCIRAATFVGVAREAYERSLEWSKTRTSGGKPLIEHQLIARRLGDMWSTIEMIRMVVWRGAWNSDAERFDTRVARLPRLMVQEAVAQVALDAVRIHGGLGTMTDFGVEKLLRDAITGLHPFPEDVHQWLLGRQLGGLGVPNSTAGSLAIR